VAPSFVRFGNFQILATNNQIDVLKRLVDHVVRGHFPGHTPGGLERIKAAADFMELGAARPYLNALSDITFTIEEQVPTGNNVLTMWTVTGTQTGELCGVPPSGAPVTIHGMTTSVIKEGLIVTEYVYWDFPAVTEQLLAAAPT